MGNVAINGFGRIGRSILRIIVENDSDINVVAINDLGNYENLAYLLKHDSVMGILDRNVSVAGDKLIVNDFDIIAELSTYILKGKSKYEADDGCSDDLVACLLLFAWLTTQTYFKELTDNDLRSRIFEEQQNLIEQDMAPFGFVDNGIDAPDDEETIDEYGTKWVPVVRKGF